MGLVDRIDYFAHTVSRYLCGDTDDGEEEAHTQVYFADVPSFETQMELDDGEPWRGRERVRQRRNTWLHHDRV